MRKTNLKLVQQQGEETKRRKQEEEGWRLTRAEVAARVREIRSHLEDVSDRLAGLHFDILNSDEPPSIDYVDEPMPCELAERLNPCLTGYYDRVYNRLPDEGCRDDVGELKLSMAETAFAIGVLAGAIFHGASGREIDRLERGLVHATVSRR